MNDKTEDIDIYGLPISPGTRRNARALRKFCAWKYRHEDKARFPVVARDNPILGPLFGVKNVEPGLMGPKIRAENGLVVAAVRMGYGHYRMAIAITSAAHSMGLTPYWFDPLAFDAPGARLIHDVDFLYSLGSRISQKSSIFNALVWEQITGKAGKRLERNYAWLEIARLFANMYKGLPADIPVVASHPWTAMGAVHAGMTNVVNIIPDNCPMGFHLAPGALHTIQGPSAYADFRMFKGLAPAEHATCGVPASALRFTGHYVDHELVANIETDCAARLKRIGKKAPRRLLLTIGGAGAQQPLVVALIEHLLPSIHDGRVVLFVNFGDHKNVWEYVCAQVPGFEETAQWHFRWNDSVAFMQAAVSGEVAGLHAFLHPDTFAAVYTTNLLMRASDLMLTKPSELAYYPIPKLFLQRVGGHEAWGAIRAAELGDGTAECESTPAALQALDLLIREDDLLAMYCENILKLKKMGIYNGAYRVVELAIERRKP